MVSKESDGSMDAFDLAKEKVLVIYHKNCADGFTAAWVFYHAAKERFNWDITFHPSNYGEVPPIELIDKDTKVVIADFSYKMPMMKEVCIRAKEVWLIDHHKTAIDEYGCSSCIIDSAFNNFYTYVDSTRSGARLAWDWIYNAPLNPDSPLYIRPPRYLEHVEDRDLWKFSLANTRELSAFLFSHEYSFEMWDKLMMSDGVELMKYSVAGAAIERKHHKDVRELVDVTRRMMVLQHSQLKDEVAIPVANLPYTYASDAAHLMAKEYKDGTIFAACYWDTPTGRTFSLRSTPNGRDVSAVAKHYGGGGHFHAAGFSVPLGHPLANSSSDLYWEYGK